MNKNYKNIQMVLEILKNEVDGDVQSALNKMAKRYSMTWMYKGDKILFPKTPRNIKNVMKKTYPIKGREYVIKNIATAKDVVMIEMIESYPDPKTKKIYRTPLVIVLEIKNGKILTGRHYCDPDLSYLYLTKRQLEKAFCGRKKHLAVIK